MRPSELFLRDLWYMPALARQPEAGRDAPRDAAGRAGAAGPRCHDGAVFALRDICPHRGVPLSAGRIMAENTVECPYHGWRFRKDGVCSAIPSLVPGQDLDPEKIRVRTYPVREQDGLIWVYMAAKPGAEPQQRAAAVPHRCRAIALDRDPDLPLRHRPCRDRADGPGAWALCPCPLVVEAHAAGEGKALRAAAQRLCDDARTSRPSRSIPCWAMSRPRSPSNCPPPASRPSSGKLLGKPFKVSG